MKYKIKRIYETSTHLLSYIGCILLSALIMYYLNGTIGVFLISGLTVGLVFSLLLTIIALKTLTVEISSDSSAAAKGETMNCIVKLSNSLWLPVPIAEIEAECSPHLDIGDVSLFKLAVAGKHPNSIKIPITAVHSGLASIKIKRVSLSDFLGIFSFDLHIPDEERVFKAAIYPDIPDAAVQTEFLKTTNNFTGSDDEEEESNETSPIPTGLPGYDHREYVPGDPIKRINWKLSSKRDIYMIRLDEQIRGTGQMFFLDCPVTEESELTLSVRDNIIEGALVMLSMLVKEGRDAFFYYCGDGLWLANEIHEQNDIYRLQEMLSRFSPSEPPAPVPPEIINSGKTPICFTAAVGDNCETAAFIASKHPEALIISSQEADVSLSCSGHWIITEDFEFSKIG